MATPQNVLFIYTMQGQLLNGSGPNAFEYVYWDVYNTPDLTGAQSGYPGLLQNIVVVNTQQISSTTNTAVVPTSTATGDLSGNYPNPTVSGIQGNPVQAGTLGSAQDGYVATYVNADGKIEFKPPTIVAGLAGDVTGATSSNTVVSLTGTGNKVSIKAGNVDFSSAVLSPPIISQDALASTSTGNGFTGSPFTIQGQAGQAATGPAHAGGQGGSVFIKGGAGGTSGSSTPGASGSVEIQDATGSNAINIISSLGTILENAKTEIDLAVNNHFQIVLTDGNVNVPSLAGSGSAGVQTDASGNLSRGTPGTNATQIQSKNVSSTAPTTSSFLQFDGTSYTPTGAPNKIIYGQNPLPIGIITSAIDDAPIIQAFINANPLCGTLRLVGCCLKTPLDFTPWTNNYNVLEIQNTLVCAMNKAEIDMVATMTLQGVGAYAGAGNTGLKGPQAAIYTFNSSNSQVNPEPNSISTDGYVGSTVFSVYSFNTNAASLPDNCIGQTFHLTSVSNATWDGYWTLIAQSGSLTYIIPQAGTNPVGLNNAFDISWSIAGHSGIDGDNAGDGPLPCYAVYQCKGLQAKSWKHWMSLNNTSNAILQQKIHRIVGVSGYNGTYYTTAYVSAVWLQNVSTTLPDYGVGGTNPSNAAIIVYEAFPMVRLVNACTVRNITADYGQAPGFCIDGVMGEGSQQNAVVEGCSGGGYGVFGPCNAGIPLVVDDMFFFVIKDCSFGNDGGNQNASMLFTTTSGLNGEYCGVGQISNIFLNNYGVVIWDEGLLSVPTGLQFDNVFIDGIHQYQSTGYFALFLVGSAVSYTSINNCQIADPSGIYYIMESLYGPGAVGSSLVGSALGTTIVNSHVLLGPNITAVSYTDITQTGVIQQLNSPQWSGAGSGFTDSMELGVGDDFSPVLSLPFQLPVPDLRTVAQWQALTTQGVAPTFSNVTSDGYLLQAPDGSLGKAIRISGSSGQAVIFQTTIANPQIGDVFITFIRARSSNSTPLGFNGQGGAALQGLNSPYYSPLFDGALAQYLNSNAPIWYLNKFDSLQGGQWFDTTSYNKITGFFGSTGAPAAGIKLIISGNAYADTIVDPESIAVLYIPVGTHPSNMPPTEIVRYYRKIRRQVSSATVGDVAIPSRVGLSLGPSSVKGSRIQTDGYVTTSTAATTAFSYSVPSSQSFNIKADWVATNLAHIADGYVSGGSFNVVGYANASGTTTISGVNTFGSNYNCGTSGAAASTPITLTHGTNVVNIQVNANTSAATDWQFTITQTNTS